MKILAEADKSGAEWVVVAYDAQDERMIEVTKGDISPHVITGSLIAGCSQEDVERDNKIVGHNTDPVTIRNLRKDQFPELEEICSFLPRTMSIRQAGKKSNHGLNYDMQYTRFALENEMPLSESKDIVQLYRTRAYPGVPLWHEDIRQRVANDRELVNCFGRKRPFPGPLSTSLFQQAYAYIPQSTVGDICFTAMRQWRRDTLGLELLSNVHDSLLTQFDAESPEDVPYDSLVTFATDKEYLNPVCCYKGREFQIPTDLKLGVAWGEDDMVEVPCGDPNAMREAVEANWSKISGEAN